MKNTPGAERTEPGPHLRSALVSPLIWGGNLWLILVGWPSYASARLTGDGLLAAACLLPLPVAAGLWSSPRPAWWTRAALLVAYPAVLALGVCLHDEAAAPRLDAVALAVATACAWAYGAAVTRLRRPAAHEATVRFVPLAPDRRATTTRPRWSPRRLAAPTMIVGAVAIALIAPMHEASASIHSAFGPAAGPASVLIAVVAAGLSCAVAGAFLAEALRPAPPPKPGAVLRATTSVMLAVLGAMTYYVLHGR